MVVEAGQSMVAGVCDRDFSHLNGSNAYTGTRGALGGVPPTSKVSVAFTIWGLSIQTHEPTGVLCHTNHHRTTLCTSLAILSLSDPRLIQ